VVLNGTVLFDYYVPGFRVTCASIDHAHFAEWCRTMLADLAQRAPAALVGLGSGRVDRVLRPFESFHGSRWCAWGPAVVCALGNLAHARRASDESTGRLCPGLDPERWKFCIDSDQYVSCPTLLDAVRGRWSDCGSPRPALAAQSDRIPLEEPSQGPIRRLLSDATLIEPLLSACMALVVFSAFSLMVRYARSGHVAVLDTSRDALLRWAMALAGTGGLLIGLLAVSLIRRFVEGQVKPTLGRYHVAPAHAELPARRGGADGARPDGWQLARRIIGPFVALHVVSQFVAMWVLDTRPGRFPQVKAAMAAPEPLDTTPTVLGEWFLGADPIGRDIAWAQLLIIGLFGITHFLRWRRMSWSGLYVGRRQDASPAQVRWRDGNYRLAAIAAHVGVIWTLASLSPPVTEFEWPSWVAFSAVSLSMLLTVVHRALDWSADGVWLHAPAGGSLLQGLRRRLRPPPPPSEVEEQVRADMIRAGAELMLRVGGRQLALLAGADDPKKPIEPRDLIDSGWVIFDQHWVVHLAVGAPFEVMAGSLGVHGSGVARLPDLWAGVGPGSADGVIEADTLTELLRHFASPCEGVETTLDLAICLPGTPPRPYRLMVTRLASGGARAGYLAVLVPKRSTRGSR